MIKRKLGTTNLDVSLICLGTMTWGSQNTESEGHEQMDYAVDQGINFFDTAELYAIPPKAETYGRTEEIIGSWFQKSGKRDQIILASKIAGPTTNSWIRNADTGFDDKSITEALDNSLKRLQTDYIDLYQLHWPLRKVNSFGRLDYQDNMHDTVAADQILNTLQVLDNKIKDGKIRHIGLSNETPWGMMKFLQLAEKYNLPRIQSVQNPYSLLNRAYDIGMAEISMQENCGLLAYSPTGRGRLSGKYLGGALPEGSSKSIDDRYSRYDSYRAEQATQAYVAIADRYGLDPAQMAIAFVNSRPYVTANIIGATTMEQLKSDIAAVDWKLDDEVIAAIDAVHRDNPNPSER
jgi:aryl-alcohol dehydrogenase-like predicted oxidoreductase